MKKVAIASPYLSIISTNVNGLNSIIKRHRMAERINSKTHHMLSMETV